MNRFLLMLDTASAAVTETAAEAVKSVEQFDNWTFAERVSESLKISGLGMGTVFAVLIILWGCLELFRIVFYEIPKRRKSGGVPEKPVKVEKPKAEKVTPAPVVKAADDAEIVAAITAAIACMTDRPASSFRVVSFRKTGTR